MFGLEGKEMEGRRGKKEEFLYYYYYY